MSQQSSYVAWNGSEYSGFPQDYSSELDFQGGDQYFPNGIAGQYDQPDQKSPSGYGYATDRLNDRDDLQEAFVRGSTTAVSTSTANRVSRVSQVSRDVDKAFASNVSTTTDHDQRKPRKHRSNGGGRRSQKKKDEKKVEEMDALDKYGYDEVDEEVYYSQQCAQTEQYDNDRVHHGLQ